VRTSGGSAWIRADTNTYAPAGTLSKLTRGEVEVAITANGTGNPRVDRIVLEMGDPPAMRAVAGTPTSGATLDNRSGAAAVPNDCVPLADVLVAPSVNTITGASIRDRRPWARGAFYTKLVSAQQAIVSGGFSDFAGGAAAFARLETSGAPMRYTLSGSGAEFPVATPPAGHLALRVIQGLTAIGPEHTVYHRYGNANGVSPAPQFSFTHDFIPSAGSLSFYVQARWLYPSSGAYAWYVNHLRFTVEELIREPSEN
jgi:hypothetical protein